MDYALQLLVYSISAFGLAYVVGHAEISLGWRTRWSDSRRRQDVFRCDVCIATNQLDDPETFKWRRSDMPADPRVMGLVVCPNNGKAHDAGVKLDQKAPDPFLLRLIECPACLGAWIGLAAAPLFLHQSLLTVLLLPLYTAGSNFLLGRATGLIPNPNEET